MAVTIKTPEEIEIMREAGKMLAKVHSDLKKSLHEGMTTLEIDKLGEEMIRDLGCQPSFLNYNGYPASVCVSLNNQVVHGIPSKEMFLESGDIVSLDIGLIHKGYHSDAARTYPVGEVAYEVQQLIDVTRESFFQGIKMAKAGNHLHDISAAIGNYAKGYGFSVVRELCGHGIGASLHEEPNIPNYRKLTRGIRLQEGMTLAIEPMINMGSRKVLLCDDDWTVTTYDGLYSAHYENTIVITDGKPEILTLTDEEIENK